MAPIEEKAKELAACPFCGCDEILCSTLQKPERHGWLPGYAVCEVQCKHCGAELHGFAITANTTDAEAAAEKHARGKWNGRLTPHGYHTLRDEERTRWQTARATHLSDIRERGEKSYRAIDASRRREALRKANEPNEA